MGPTISLPRIVRAITADRHAWSAFAAFAARVMRSKEALEREVAWSALHDRDQPP